VLEAYYFEIVLEYGRNYIPCHCSLKKSFIPVTCVEDIMEENGDLPGQSFWIYHD
jgi:hypothetical protein